METSLNDMSETNELNEVNNTVEAELTGLTDHSDENTDKRFSEERSSDKEAKLVLLL